MSSTLTNAFVRSVPDELERGVLYVSMEFASAIHLCACGCARQVVTPLARDGWTLTYRGGGITLSPSIGNWKLPCRSHYWIRDGQIEWAQDSVKDVPQGVEAVSWLRRLARRLRSALW